MKMDNHNPERFARPGENPLIDETFRPTITKKRVEAVKAASGNTTSTGDRFLDRLPAREKTYRKTHPKRKKYEPKRLAAWGTTVRTYICYLWCSKGWKRGCVREKVQTQTACSWGTTVRALKTLSDLVWC